MVVLTEVRGARRRERVRVAGDRRPRRVRHGDHHRHGGARLLRSRQLQGQRQVEQGEVRSGARTKVQGCSGPISLFYNLLALLLEMHKLTVYCRRPFPEGASCLDRFELRIVDFDFKMFPKLLDWIAVYAVLL